ncbi:PIN domain-containing protein [Erythrobacter sp. CCH5-A1]|uniref:PIN domain-containing protein n=1 Tax=Erythrobacter sp. CCH5-A1 TaxID=1768792 RepID=UPI00083173BA|nr:PIN domain-containing protein [Erythrobacter sp. CCH5-A1]
MSAVEQEAMLADTPLIVVPDANVIIHGKSLVDLPWAELGYAQIEVVFVPPMIRELDKLKTQTGRQNKLARQLSSEIRTLITSPGRRAEVRAASPNVVKRVELQAVTDAVSPALRLEHADQALINYALWLGQAGANVLLLTDDTICGTTAQEVGLPVHFLPEHWLRSPEPDESAKDNARLRAEVQRLSSAEPKIELSFRDEVGTVVSELKASLLRWPALEGHQVEVLMSEVERLCPRAVSFERPKPRATDSLVGRLAAFERMSHISAFSAHSVYEPATEEEIEQYRATDYPNWLHEVRKALETLHHRLDARTVWPDVVAVAENIGTRPATEALLSIRARGAFELLNDEGADEDDEGQLAKAPSAALELPLPPAPPRGRTKIVGPLANYRGLQSDHFATARHFPLTLPHLSPPKSRDSDAFYWRVGRRDWTTLMELECASWRHGQTGLEFPLRIRPVEQEKTSGLIEFSLHAHNLSTPKQIGLPVRIDFKDGQTLAEARVLVELLGKAARAKGRL